MRISHLSPTLVELTFPNVVILFSYNNPVALRVKDSDVVLRVPPGRCWVSTHINRWIRGMDHYGELGSRLGSRWGGEFRKYSTLVKYIRVVEPEFFDNLFNYNGLDCVVHRQIGISLNEYRKKLKGDRDLLRHSSNAPTNSLPDSVHNQGVPVSGPSNPERERQRFVTGRLFEHNSTLSVPRAGSTGQTTQAEEAHYAPGEVESRIRVQRIRNAVGNFILARMPPAISREEKVDTNLRSRTHWSEDELREIGRDIEDNDRF